MSSAVASIIYFRIEPLLIFFLVHLVFKIPRWASSFFPIYFLPHFSSDRIRCRGWFDAKGQMYHLVYFFCDAFLRLCVITVRWRISYYSGFLPLSPLELCSSPDRFSLFFFEKGFLSSRVLSAGFVLSLLLIVAIAR